jgi:DNA-binding MarR family transcriptional regulator
MIDHPFLREASKGGDVFRQAFPYGDAAFGLTRAALRVLLKLQLNGPTRMKDLARSSGVSRRTVERGAHELTSQGWVRIEVSLDGIRPRYLLSLTPEGHHAAAGVIEVGYSRWRGST